MGTTREQIDLPDFGTATPANVRRVRLASGPADRPTGIAPPAVPLTIVVWGMRTKSELNQRGHWGAKHRRFKSQSSLLSAAICEYRPALALAGWEVANHGASLAVTLTRIGPRRLDSDNLASAFKLIRDDLASYLGVDDGNPLISWRYDQRRGEDGVILTVGPPVAPAP